MDTDISKGFESKSGFRNAFSKIMGAPPVRSGQVHLLKADWIATPLGPMIAIGDEDALYLLEFIDQRGLERKIERLGIDLGASISPGKTKPIHSIENELNLYFQGRLNDFQTPLKMLGSDFQKSVWIELQKIPIGETRSYLDLAKRIGNPKAVRAVAGANGSNPLTLAVPCHRIIQSNGELGGYAGGIERKKWLLSHEGGVTDFFRKKS